MASYRAYLLDANSHVVGFAHIIERDSDDDALVVATSLLSEHDVELWEGERLVRRLTSRQN